MNYTETQSTTGQETVHYGGDTEEPGDVPYLLCGWALRGQKKGGVRVRSEVTFYGSLV